MPSNNDVNRVLFTTYWVFNPMNKIFYKVIGIVAILITWLIGMNYLSETLINEEASTAYVVLFIFITLIVTYLFYKLITKIYKS